MTARLHVVRSPDVLGCGEVLSWMESRSFVLVVDSGPLVPVGSDLPPSYLQSSGLEVFSFLAKISCVSSDRSFVSAGLRRRQQGALAER